MEATTRQLNYIKVLAERAGKRIEPEDMEGLSKEEASRTIDRLQGKKESRNGQAQKGSRPPVVDNALFGLAAKLIWRQYLATSRTPRKGEFSEDVIRTYIRLRRMRKELRQKLGDGTQ
jgi:hypothetical protein